VQGVEAVLAAIESGKKRIVLTSPTGGGKSVMMLDLAQWYLSRDLPVAIFTNRRMLLEQLADTVASHRIEFGVRAAGHGLTEALLQVVSTQTAASRGVGFLPKAALVIVDEAHLHNHKAMWEIQTYYIASGAAWVGITATPIDLGLMYHHLIVAGTNSELRTCRALVPCIMYGPDEPDLRSYRAILQSGKDLSEEKAASAMGPRPKLFGRVGEWFGKLNPQRKPTILFAAGVPESVWFAQEFTKRGIPAAHIDGAEVWVDGEFHRTSEKVREQVMDDSREGRIVVLCNRFVLREGIDAPWLAHGIFATVFGSLQTYLQSGGRLLRAHPGLERVTLQDHGGNWHRHGSLNADRQWNIDLTALVVAGLREDRMRAKLDPEPIRCPACGLILGKLIPGQKCVCGFSFTAWHKSRPVVTQEGEMIALNGDIFPARRTAFKPDTIEKWIKIFWQAKNSQMTFRQAEGFFAQKHLYWPPRTLPCMPKEGEPLAWFAKVRDVDRSLLRPPPPRKPKPEKQPEPETPNLFTEQS